MARFADAKRADPPTEEVCPARSPHRHAALELQRAIGNRAAAQVLARRLTFKPEDLPKGGGTAQKKAIERIQEAGWATRST